MTGVQVLAGALALVAILAAWALHRQYRALWRLRWEVGDLRCRLSQLSEDRDGSQRWRREVELWSRPRSRN